MINKVAAIILNYDSSDDCRKCISFLKRQEEVELELILVDNCSPDCDKVKALCQEEGCTFISSKENRGYNAGNNIGLRYAASKEYKYALIANPDMKFSQVNYVKLLVEAIEQDEKIVVVGSDIIGVDGIHQNPLVRDGNWTTSFNWVKGLLHKKCIDAYDFIDNYKESHYCAKVSGCCFLIRLSFFNFIYGFDEKIFLYCEEAILSRQVEQSGMKMYYISEAQATHVHVNSKKGNPIQRMKHWEKSRNYFIEKYSNDCWFGKKIAKLSTSIYTWLFILSKKIK